MIGKEVGACCCTKSSDGGMYWFGNLRELKATLTHHGGFAKSLNTKHRCVLSEAPRYRALVVRVGWEKLLNLSSIFSSHNKPCRRLARVTGEGF